MSYNREFERRAREKLNRDLGLVIGGALADPTTIEVLLNPDGRIWQERLGEPMRCIGSLPRHYAEAVLKTLASHLDEQASKDAPLLEGDLRPDGLRFAGQLPPVVSAPSFAIRVPAVSVFTLGEYVVQGVMTSGQCDAIERVIAGRKNILVVGGTGSGKTTLVNAIIDAMVECAPDDRVVILEDTREIQCNARNCVQYRAGRNVGMTDLLRTTLHMRPDRILVGEVRGPEALDLLMAWNTGHTGGAATLHANSALSGLTRLETLVSMHDSAPTQPALLIAEAVDVVVHIARTAHGRRVQAVLAVLGVHGGEYETRNLL